MTPIMSSTRKNIALFLGTAAVISLCLTPFLSAASETDLPEYVKDHLSYLDETYHILDLTAENIWPGWTNYKDFPFMFDYPNGLRVLIGHPVPPKEFHKIEEYSVGGMDVYVDSSKVSDLVQELPLAAGGGPLLFGTDKEGKPIRTVFMNFFSAKDGLKGGNGMIAGPYAAESQIIGFIHELFHCFQLDGSNIKLGQAGNLHMNPDTGIAVYSEIEGKALLKAYQSKSDQEAEMYIRDFIAARMIKYEKHMPEKQQRQEAGDDLLEGTAVYTSVRLGELLNNGYANRLDPSDIPYFSAFQNADFYIDGFQNALKNATAEIFDIKRKTYEYGCYQALLLQRFVPGWQAVFSQKQTDLYQELYAHFPVRKEDLSLYEKRFHDVYDINNIQSRCSAAIKERDNTYFVLKNQKGMAYVINLKKVNQYEMKLYDKVDSISLGVINIYREGLPPVKFGNYEISSIPGPLVGEQIFHLKVVDTKWKPGTDPYSITFTRQDGNIFEGAVITTPLFTIKAPLVRIDQTSSRVKFTLLQVLKKQ